MGIAADQDADQEIDMPNFRSTDDAFAVPALLAGLTTALTTALTAALTAALIPATVVNAQPMAGSTPASATDAAAKGNKAGKPPVDAAASQADVATKKPAKPGAQAGPVPPSGAQAEDAMAAKGNKAGKPPVDAAASRAGVATKKPAKPGAQSGPVPASAPER